MKYVVLFSCILISCCSCSSQKNHGTAFFTKGNFTIHEAFKDYFDACGVAGSVVIFDNNNQHWILSDTSTVLNESLPASTFKIINLLIALETKTIKDENEIVKWSGSTDTTKYGYRPEIYHDMSVKEAFEVSAGWVFIELAKKIGKGNYSKFLTAAHYGNLNLTENNDDFWNFGNFAISPTNQVAFIKNLYNESLPFSKQNIAKVKKVMITEVTDDYKIAAKTGWTRDKGINTGWWVGYLETNANTYFFATRLLQDRSRNRDDFGSCRKSITKNIFTDLGFIKTANGVLNGNHSPYLAIDHIPIAVNNLEKIKQILTQDLHFTLKEGKPHESVSNCFVKFQDGAYLEFITPTNPTLQPGKYYADFLKTRQGATSPAISTSNHQIVANLLNEKNIPFTADSNSIWHTIDPEKPPVFFIEYSNRNWKERKQYSTHTNTALAISATYMLTNNLEETLQQFAAVGMQTVDSGTFAGSPYKRLSIGNSNLFLLDAATATGLPQSTAFKLVPGICGFRVKVSSLKTFNNMLKSNAGISYEKDQTTIYLNDYHLFLTFSE